VAIALDGQGPTCVATAADGRALRPAIAWSDRRAVVERDELAAAAGLPGWLLGILPSALWIERHEPGIASAAVAYLAAWEWLGLRLSGVAAGTVTPSQDVPDPAIVASVGLPSSKVPATVAAGSILGGLQPEAAAALRLPSGIPIVAGLNDAYASCLGAGLLEPGDALDTGGSSGGLVVYTNARPDVPGAWIAPAPLDGRWLVGGAMAATGRALDWLRDDVLGGDLTTDELLAAAASTPPGAEGLVFLPYLAGERSPIWDASARGVFAGLTLRHERGHLARAVLEGAAFALRDVAEPIRAAGYPIHDLRVCGGPARSEAWNRIKADVLGVPVEVPAVTDTAMLGAAILGAVAIGAEADFPSAIASMVRVERRIEPDAATQATYETLFGVYRDLYPALRPIMHALGELESAG
jgi:xylulokinase